MEITRAMRRLTISYCDCRIKYGDLSPCLPSSFLAELDPLYLEQVSYEDVMQQPVTQESAAVSFSAMRALLGGNGESAQD